MRPARRWPSRLTGLVLAMTGAMIGATLIGDAWAPVPTAQAAPLPRWLSIRDLGRPPQAGFPGIPTARLERLRREKHGYVERLRRHEITLGSDGLVDDRLVLVRQFLDEQGVRSGGTISLHARTRTDRLSIDEAYVLLPDGRRRSFEARLIQVRATTGRDMFSDLVEVALPFPSLEVGSTVVVSVRRTHDRRRWPLPWSQLVYTQEMVPLESLELSLRWPKGTKAPLWKTDDPQLTCTQQDDGLHCRRSSIDGLPYDPEVASWTDLVPHVVFSAEGSWNTLGALERKLLGNPKGSPSLTAVARRLVAKATSDEERVQRLFRFAADEIRYVGFEHGEGAVVPRPPAVTLERRFGDCKDKVALLLALAAAVGIEMYPVLVATDRLNADKLLLPSWKYFDHVIACARTDKWMVRCMDPTDPDLPAGTLSLGVRSAVALPLEEWEMGPHQLPQGPDQGRYGWNIEVESRNELACDGSVDERVTRTYRGSGAGSMRGRLRGDNAADRERWMENAYASIMGEDVKPTVLVVGLDDPNAPLVLETQARFPGRSSSDKWQEYAEKDHWLVGIGDDFRGNNRHHPYVLSGLRLVSRVSYAVCPQVVPNFTGPELQLKSEFGLLKRSYEREGQVVTVNSVLTLEPQTIPARKIASFNKFLDAALGQSRIWFGLTQAPAKESP